MKIVTTHSNASDDDSPSITESPSQASVPRVDALRAEVIAPRVERAQLIRPEQAIETGAIGEAQLATVVSVSQRARERGVGAADKPPT